MKTLDELTKEELIDLENRCWMTHDGMWFYSCLSSLGIETANRLNKSTISTPDFLNSESISIVLGLTGCSDLSARRASISG